MLLSFTVKNYRSFKDETILDLEATGLSEYKECLLKNKNSNYLPVTAIYGKNGGGKSNIIRAFWLAVQFICNAQRTQTEEAAIPVRPFVLDNESQDNPTEFVFLYVHNNIKYEYQFSATQNNIVSESLYYWPKNQRAKVFERNYQEFIFPENNEKKQKQLMSKAVAANQLFFAIACVMNYETCINAMAWFRKQVIFTRDYADIGKNLLDNRENPKMIKAIENIAKIADIGIAGMDFEFRDINITDLENLPADIHFDERQAISNALKQLQNILNNSGSEAENQLMLSELKVSSYHCGVDREGNAQKFKLDLNDESDGTRKLMSIAPAIERALETGGIVLIDEIEKELHPLLVEYIINRFQNSESNTNNAQLIFTTHSAEIMNREILRRDQIYFADKNSKTGVSELYSLADYSPRKDENVYLGYMLGKYGAIPMI